MEERVGAYIINSEGQIVPDLTDEAMAARQIKPTPNPTVETGFKPVSTIRKTKQEVNKDA